MTIITSMKRQIYQQLLNWKSQKNRKPLIIKGIRQCGKTYLLRQFGKSEFLKVHYVNFEKDPQLGGIFEINLNPKRIINELEFHFGSSIDTQQDLLIFDEIQACSAALTSLKYFQEELPELALCSAGSLLGVHLSPASFPVGKVMMLNMYPLSFAEFLLAIEDQKGLDFLDDCRADSRTPDIVHQHLWERLKWYFVVGGLPEAVDSFRQMQEDLFLAFEHVRKKQEDLIKGYNADMAKHSGKVNALHLDRIWRAVSAQLARTEDGSATKFKFKEIVPGIDRYQRLASAIDWLNAAGLIIKVPIVHTAQLPLNAYTEESRFKLYVFDIGILGALSNLAPKVILNYDYGTYKGYFAENFVAQEFLVQGHQDLFSWQEQRAEVEFLYVDDLTILPIEIKSGWIAKSRSLQIFSEKYHPPYRTIMSAHSLKIDQKNRVHHYPLYLAYRFPLKPS
jgi:uncharacterized protein